MKNVYIEMLKGKNLKCNDQFHKFILTQEGKEYYKIVNDSGFIFKNCVTDEIQEIVNYLDEFEIEVLNKNDTEF